MTLLIDMARLSGCSGAGRQHLDEKQLNGHGLGDGTGDQCFMGLHYESLAFSEFPH